MMLQERLNSLRMFLGEEVFAKFQKNTTEDLTNKPSDRLILGAFVWSESPEGLDYWFEKYLEYDRHLNFKESVPEADSSLSKTKVIFEKTYNGFEDVHRFEQDAHDALSQSSLPDEFKGKLTIKLTYIPADDEE